MNGGTSPPPHRLEDLSLERSELGPESSFEEGTKRVHFVDDKRILEGPAEQLTPMQRNSPSTSSTYNTASVILPALYDLVMTTKLNAREFLEPQSKKMHTAINMNTLQ